MDLGSWLRRLRRDADLSQRELAEKAGVAFQTVARIESGATPDPRFRTVERLITSAGGQLSIVDTGGQAPATVPYDNVVDAAERRYPPHLDVRPVRQAADWWGSGWARYYHVEREYWPAKPPAYSFDLSRRWRDRLRRQRPPDRGATP